VARKLPRRDLAVEGDDDVGAAGLLSASRTDGEGEQRDCQGKKESLTKRAIHSYLEDLKLQ
jgi:hypothetical protein